MNADRHMLNRAFWDLGFRFQWDEATWNSLAALPDLRAQLRYYLEHYQPHLLAVYDSDLLGQMVESRLGAPLDRVGMESYGA